MLFSTLFISLLTLLEKSLNESVLKVLADSLCASLKLCTKRLVAFSILLAVCSYPLASSVPLDFIAPSLICCNSL